VIVLVLVMVPVQSHCSWILSQIFPSMIMTTVTTFVLKKYQSWYGQIYSTSQLAS
jgi:hypothetical protein